MLQNKIGFIGGGAIAEALISGIIRSGLVSPDNIIVSDIIPERLNDLQSKFSIGVTADNLSVLHQADVLFLAIKPQVAPKLLDAIGKQVSHQAVVVSVIAGLTLARLQEYFPNNRVVRVMPNTPVAVGAGMSAIALGQTVDAETGNLIGQLFSASGNVVYVDDSAMDAVTGLSGSGPGYGFVLIDALADAGVRAGLARKTAILLAAQTLLGAAKMVLDTGEHPAVLRDMVTSPAGTTIAGIQVLEQRAVRAALIDAVAAAAERSKEIGRAK